MLFGSDLFQEYMGELMVASSARLATELSSIKMQVHSTVFFFVGSF